MRTRRDTASCGCAAQRGNAPAGRERCHKALRATKILRLKPKATVLAEELARQGGLPRKAQADAFHVAIAVVDGMDYLLTWNCKHIANATMRGRIESICRSAGFEPAIICTPEELVHA